MNKDIIISGSVGLILGILFAPVFSPVMPMMYRNSMMGGNQMMGQIDSHFIEQMIPHHEDAITMAQVGLTRAEHPEIRSLANAIIKAQSEEIDQMEHWYTSWFGQDVQNSSNFMGHGTNMMMHGGMMGDAADMEHLESVVPFDKAFIEEMIPHHQMAVMMAQMLERATSRAEMKQLAKNITEAQNKEIDSMRSWYRQWYE